MCTLLNTPALSVTLLPELLNKTSTRSLPFHSTSQPLPPHPLFGWDGLYWPGYSSYWSTVCAAFTLFLITAQQEDNMHPNCTLLLPQTTFPVWNIACWQQSCLLLPLSIQNPFKTSVSHLTIIFSGSPPSERKRSKCHPLSKSVYMWWWF